MPDMSRKYQVFVSSTLEDLREERDSAVRGIFLTGHMPLCLEEKPPSTATELESIQAAISDCQFCVVILGHCYGSKPQGYEKSYVELEYERAMSQPNCHVLVFVLEKSKAESRRAKLTEVEEKEIANKDDYWRFRTRLTEDEGHTDFRHFGNAREIGEHLIAFFSQEHPKIPGFILEPTDDSGIAVEKGGRVLAVSHVVSEVLDKLKGYVDYEPRLRKAPEKKQTLGRVFSNLVGGHLSTFDQIFLESGSTITMVARELEDRLPKGNWNAPDRMDAGIRPRIRTNNAFAYLYYWLNGITCDPVPEGPPDARYGGMYGRLTDRQRDPDYTCPSLATFDPKGEEIIEDLKKSIFRKQKRAQGRLVLAAASGVQLTDDYLLVRPRRDTGEEHQEFNDDVIANQIRENCRGFHVGSYNNKLFKRCLYLTGVPTIVFVHNHKIDSPIEVGRCHFVFDGKDAWAETIREYPLAMWIACNSKRHGTTEAPGGAETVDEVMAKLESGLTEGQWVYHEHAHASDHPIITCYNKPFGQAWKKLGFDHEPFR